MRCRNRIRGERDRVGESLTPVVRSLPPLLATLAALCWLGAASLRAQTLPDAEIYYPAELEHRARLAVTQNLADYIFLGTLNAEAQYSVHRNWTLSAGTRYNNWTWRHRQDTQFQARQKTFYVGGRWWPWYTYSGWWAGGKLQYQEYNRGGLLGPETEEGDAVGLSLGGGYAVHVNHWLNVDFGLFGWGGMTRYVTYACPYCGQRTGEGTKAFILPDEVRVALQFIF